MITVYAGLWYITDDIGQVTQILLFTLILTANAIFGCRWLIAYISKAQWAGILVKRFLLEHSYIACIPIIPYFPLHEFKSNLRMFQKDDYLRHLILGDQFYTDHLSVVDMQNLMNDRRSIVMRIYDDALN